MSDEAISQEALEAARLRLKRRVASVLIKGLAESGLTLAETDARLGRKAGYTRRFLLSLIEGTTSELNLVSDMAVAMDREVDIRLSQAGHEDIAEPHHAHSEWVA